MNHISSEQTKGFPLSEAVCVGATCYLSGQIGIDKSQQLVAGGVGAETRQVFENIKDLLERCGSSLDRVVKVTVMLTDIDDWAEMNKVYTAYFSKPLPARSAFAVNGLALGAKVEIECIAAIDEK